MGKRAYMMELERELTAMTEQRDEWKAKYIQQNKDLGCEMMDPNGTIWDHAKKVQLELTAMTEQQDGLRSGIDYASEQLHKVREQRDRLAKAIITHRAKAFLLTGEDFDQELWQALQSLTPTQPEPK